MLLLFSLVGCDGGSEISVPEGMQIVKQSKKDKSAVADVPEVVGSMIGTGFLILAGGIGAALGVGGTILLQKTKKKKESTDESKALA